MPSTPPRRSIDRRRFLQLVGVGAAAGIAPIACGTGGSPTSSGPSATPVPAASGGQLKQVARNRTLVLGLTGGQLTDAQTFNPYLLTTSTSTGYPYCYEPLFFYNSYHTDKVSGPPGMQSKDGTVPWLGESFAFNGDFTQVTVKIRNGVEWSDGQPFTANDVLYTVNMLKQNAPKLTWSVDMQTWVKDITAVDDHTVRFTLNARNPRFLFDFFIHHQDIGVPIVPQHIWTGQDASQFAFLDIAKGWPVTTSPWKMVLTGPDQRIFDRRDDWWAKKTGFHDEPAIERIVVVPGTDETKMVQFAIADSTDETIDLRPANIKAVLGQNKDITTWTGGKPPYGYRDWWPVSLGFNCSQAPYDDKDIRWAINHTINRKQIVQVGYQGAGEGTLIPFPNFPAMMPYLNKVKDLANTIDAFNLNKTASIMKSKGYQKDGNGFWSKGGKRFSMLIYGLILFQDILPVVVQQLRKGGFDASFRIAVGDEFTQKLYTGEMDGYLYGHGGSVRDPYPTMKLYHSRYSAPTGQQATYPYRWVNKQFDALVDQMGQLDITDPKLPGLFRDAMKIWVPELPDVGLVQWFHRIPTDTKYWTSWPTENNPYINSCYWHRTSPLWINTIKPTQK